MPDRASRIRVKRAYEPPEESDGCRVLVDALWPRGVSKDALAVETWLRDIAPSTDLRKWYGHDPDRWEEFRTRYAAELADRREAVERLLALCRERPVTLVYSSRETRLNNAVALAAYLEERLAN